MSVELLEPRNLPAGRVTAAIMDGVLLVQGDHRDNAIVIERTGLDPGQVRIQGLPSGGVNHGHTLINGEVGTVVISGVSGPIRAMLGAGHDKLIVQDAVLPGSLQVFMGTGRDAVVLDQVTVNDLVTIRTNNGRDSIHFVQSTFASEVQVFAGLGNDLIALDVSVFAGPVEVAAGQGNDTTYLDSQFNDSLQVRSGQGDDVVTNEAVEVEFDFSEGALGWQGGFADYPTGEEEFYELDASVQPLPAELGPGDGFLLQGNNHSDDLFMFLKRSLGTEDGLRPDQRYVVRFSLTFGSNSQEDSVGIGGSPTHSVSLKAGATSTEPEGVIAADGNVQLNVDKGNQGIGGRDASVVSDLSNGVADAGGEPSYVSVRKVHVHEFIAHTGADGRLWLLVGTDSGYEGLTQIYFQRIEAKLIPIG